MFSFQIQINQLKAEKFETKTHITKLEEEIKTLKTLVSHVLKYGSPNTAPNSSLNLSSNSNQSTPLNATLTSDRSFLRQNSNSSHRQPLPNDSQKRRSWCLNYGTVNVEDDPDQMRPIQQQFKELMNDELYTNSDNLNHDSTIVQMEKENLELRRGLQDAIANNKISDKKIQK